MWWRSDVIWHHLWRVRRLTCNNWMAYLKNWTDNFFQIFFRGTSWVAVSFNNIKTRASREMTSRKNIKIFYFNGLKLPSTGMWRGEVFAMSDCLVVLVLIILISSVYIQTPDRYLVPLLLSQYTDIYYSKFFFLTISVQKCVFNLKQNNIFYGVST